MEGATQGAVELGIRANACLQPDSQMMIDHM
jgi:hypothetical protein